MSITSTTAEATTAIATTTTANIYNHNMSDNSLENAGEGDRDPTREYYRRGEGAELSRNNFVAECNVQMAPKVHPMEEEAVSWDPGIDG